MRNSFLLTVVFLLPRIAFAQVPMTQSFTFGMVGVTPGQIARLSVVNSAVGPVSQTNCTIDLTFLDPDGNMLKTTRVVLNPQKSAQLDFARQDPDSAVGRIQFRALITETVVSTEGILTPGSVCAPVTTLELFNRDTGKTDLILTDPKMVPLGAAAPPGLPSSSGKSRNLR